MSSGRGDPVISGSGRKSTAVRITGNRNLTDNTFEIRFERPEGFDFTAGQKISVRHEDLSRDYSLTSAGNDNDLAICVRRIPDGALSPVLAEASKGDRFYISPAFGYFFYQSSEHPAVFVATGTGIAPFVAFVQDGAENFHLLHGVRTEAELYYRDLLSPAAETYIPCLTGPESNHSRDTAIFKGRVTDYLENQLPKRAYDFYLCGRGEMLRDATRIIDRRFEGSRVYSELFF